MSIEAFGKVVNIAIHGWFWSELRYLNDDTHMAVSGRGGYSERDKGGPGGTREVKRVRFVQMSVAFVFNT